MGPEAPDWKGQIEATAPKPRSGARRRRHRLGLQCQDKSGTGGSRPGCWAGSSFPAPRPGQAGQPVGRGHRGGTAGDKGEGGLQSVAMGTLRHPLRPRLGLLPPRSRRAPGTANKPFLNIHGPNLSLQNSLSRARRRSSRTGRQQSGFTFAPGHWGRSKAAAPEPAAVPSPCPLHCPGTSLLSRDGKRLPKGEPGTRRPWHRRRRDNFRGRAGARPGAAPAPDTAAQAGSVCSLSSHLGNKRRPSISAHTGTRGLRREHNYSAKSQRHASSSNPSWGWTGMF